MYATYSSHRRIDMKRTHHPLRMALGTYLPILLIVLFAIGPYLWTFISSITPETDLYRAEFRFFPEHPTGENYTRLFKNRGSGADNHTGGYARYRQYRYLHLHHGMERVLVCGYPYQQQDQDNSDRAPEYDRRIQNRMGVVDSGRNYQCFAGYHPLLLYPKTIDYRYDRRGGKGLIDMKHTMVESKQFDGDGLHLVYDQGEWVIGIKNYKKANDISTLRTLERHNETDESFVLLTGACTLLCYDDTLPFASAVELVAMQ